MLDKTLICIPSIFEANKIFPNIKFVKDNGFYIAEFLDHRLLITGVSKIPTTYNLTLYLTSKHPTSLMLLGVAGAYLKSSLNVGDVVTVEKDFLIDEANFDNYNLTTLHEKKFLDIKDNATTFIPIKNIKTVNSNTVSLIQNSDIISEIYRRKYLSDIENMEGSAFGYVANMFKIKSYQLRAISNFCGDVDRQAWDINLATKNLFTTLSSLIKDNVI